MIASQAMPVSALMSRDVVAVRPNASLREAARLLDHHRVDGLPVIDEEVRLVGVITRADIVRAISGETLWSRSLELPVSELMSTPPLTVYADQTLAEAAQAMHRHRVHRLVVVRRDGVTPIGVISMTDLVAHLAGAPGG